MHNGDTPYNEYNELGYLREEVKRLEAEIIRLNVELAQARMFMNNRNYFPPGNLTID